MIKRTVEISTDGHRLSIEHDQLVLTREGLRVAAIPCEDIGVLIIDAKATSFSRDALVRPLRYGAVVVLSGDDHHPAGLLLPVEGNDVQTQRMRAQIGARKPLLKQIWRRVVQAKIRGQASNLPAGHAVRERLLNMAGRVRSGDRQNVEAQASRLYWPTLLGDGFRRDREGGPPNNLLNYGYMALRAATARALAGAGLHLSLGVKHHNKYNAFCLADDLMEAYRPFVDFRVRELHRAGQHEVDKHAKATLLEVLTDTVEMSGERGPLLVALQRSAASLARCFLENRNDVDLPQGEA